MILIYRRIRGEWGTQSILHLRICAIEHNPERSDDGEDKVASLGTNCAAGEPIRTMEAGVE
jgi:hypothetical protein